MQSGNYPTPSQVATWLLQLAAISQPVPHDLLMNPCLLPRHLCRACSKAVAFPGSERGTFAFRLARGFLACPASLWTIRGSFWRKGTEGAAWVCYNKAMRFCVLASGSKGNTTYLEAAGQRFLIDAGLSCRTLEQRMAATGLSPEGLDGIFVTHEHIDHVRGLATFVAKHPTTIYTNEGTADAVERQLRLTPGTLEFCLFESRVPFMVGEVAITPVGISHDTAEPVAFTFACAEGKVGYFTDLGFVSPEVAMAFTGCSAMVLESNHDLGMLRSSGRPYHLVARISGPSGHLSNEQACEAVASAMPETLHTLVLAHLSQECNDPELARAMMAGTLRYVGREDVRLAVAKQDEPLPLLEV